MNGPAGPAYTGIAQQRSAPVKRRYLAPENAHFAMIAPATNAAAMIAERRIIRPGSATRLLLGRKPLPQPSPRASRLRREILLAIHPDQLEEIAQRERPNERAEQAEVAHAADRADQGNERVDLGEAAIDQGTKEVVHAPDHEHTPNDEEDGGDRSPLHVQADRRRTPDHAGPHDGKNRKCHRDDGPKQTVRETGDAEREAEQQPLDRGHRARSDHRGDGDVLEALAELFSVRF